MRISLDTRDELRLDHVPWITAALILTMLLACIGLALGFVAAGDWAGALMIGGAGSAVCGLALVAFVERLQLWFDRRAGTVVWRRRTLRGFSERSVPLSAVRRAVLDERRGSKGTRLFRARLVIEGADDLPLTTVWSNAGHHRRSAAAINRFLGQTDQPP